MLCAMKYLIMVSISAGFASNILFINNSVTFDKLGAINGLAVSMTAIARYVEYISHAFARDIRLYSHIELWLRCLLALYLLAVFHQLLWPLAFLSTTI